MISLELINECSDYRTFLEKLCNTFIIHNEYQNRIEENKEYLIKEGVRYIDYAKLNNLDQLLKNSELSTLEDGDVSKLYTDYFVKKMNNLYDKIKVNSRDIGCPYCGGIGYIDQIDHFLPKAQYDRFAVFPYNLIPSCVKCNEVHKKTFFPKNKNEQIIHPYLENDSIFNEQWIFGEYINNTIEYYALPPSSWTIDMQEKVKLHFKVFGLKELFGIKATSRLSDINSQIKEYKELLISKEIFEKANIDPIINHHKNSNDWERVLYLTIKQNLIAIWNNV